MTAFASYFRCIFLNDKLIAKIPQCIIPGTHSFTNCCESLSIFKRMKWKLYAQIYNDALLYHASGSYYK